jgi:ribosome-associated toxin RatA of RatAB toxin-antitoxin module
MWFLKVPMPMQLMPKLILTTTALVLVMTGMVLSPVNSASALANNVITASKTAGHKTARSTNAVPSTVSSMVLPYAAEDVWPLISNPYVLTQHAPKVNRLTLLTRRGSSQDLGYAVKLNPLLPEFNYVLRYQSNGRNTLTFERISGSFKTIQGYWKVMPLPGGKSCKVTYAVAIDPGFAAPQAWVTQAIRRDVPTLMAHVRRQVAVRVTQDQLASH